MTRAKRRLYVPAILSEKEAPLSAQSPMDLFCKHLESSLPDFLLSVSQKESVTFERLVQPLPPPPNLEKNPVPLTFISKNISYDASNVHSFTSLAQTKLESSPEFLPSPEFTLHTLPRGAETGIVIHSLFEKIFSLPDRKNDAGIDLLVEEELRFASLAQWKECIQKMVKQTLSMQLMTRDGLFCLADLKEGEMQVEMEFLFHSPPHFVKGFIDLVFCYKGRFYFLDWKTNWLGENEGSYHFASLDAAMKAHDYPLQAALYAEALRRHLDLKDFYEKFGGAFYLFVRGGAAYYLMPDLNLIREFHGTSC
jgi:exodeoxyribonuclease V beta subunit